ncbi:hypothetical protein AAGW18_03580 [Vreelandella titanicae]|uniref:hypothetical protein n=1 Tax=Vreelandella titanicae TaxID=664683 RepID=UPI00241FF22D|nr:hypothetical protein [Halomonas titanicae]
MTRVMVWNIDKFDIHKINQLSLSANPAFGLSEWEVSTGIFGYIIDNLSLTLPDGSRIFPDIFVVIEVSTEFNANNLTPGLLDTGLGGEGCLYLLEGLREASGNPNWMLVPPLQTGAFDSVAVFYDSSNLVFTGPRVWPGAQGPATDPNQVPAPATAAYPGMFAGVLPSRQVPAGLPNAGTQEDICAANTVFHMKVGAPYAGHEMDFDSQRTPYQVTFGEIDGSGAVVRMLNFFIVHSPANTNDAIQFMRTMAGTEEISSAPAINEVKAVLGDFNLNLTDYDQTRDPAVLVQTDAYEPLTDLGYDMALTSPTPVPFGSLNPATFNGYTGYLATHLKPVRRATYRYAGTIADYYPCFGITGSSQSSVKNYSLDNILARYGTAANGPMAEISIMNGTVPQPYDVVPAPPYSPPQGFYTWPMQMAAPEYQAPPPQITNTNRNGNDAPLPALDVFRQWNNYGRIFTTSDHMALIATI